MSALDPGAQWGNVFQAIAARAVTGFSDRQIRPIEYFGARAVEFNAAEVDNRTAFLQAIDWCCETGGAVMLGGGVYGVDGDLEMLPFTTFWGSGKWNSVVRQLSATAGTDTFTSPSDADGGTAYCHLRDFQIDGGWTTNWNDLAEAGAAIRLSVPTAGPSHANLLARLNVGSLSDPHNTIENMKINRHPGHGIVTAGRGENQIKHNEINLCKGNGIQAAAPDDWYSNNTVYATGDSGMLITSGNQRIENHKHWFVGMRRDAEGIGAGFEINGSGNSNIIMSNCASQDTWGPGLVADGDSLLFSGNIDEAGGGRLEQQGFGWQGARTEVRSCIRTVGLKRSKITASIRGGDRNGESARPYLVDFDSSGADINYVETYTEGASLHSNLVRASGGFNNSNRWCEVKQNGQIIMGKVSLADLQNAAHSINAEGGPSLVHLGGDEDGQIAARQDNGAWSVHSPGSVIIPA